MPTVNYIVTRPAILAGRMRLFVDVLNGLRDEWERLTLPPPLTYARDEFLIAFRCRVNLRLSRVARPSLLSLRAQLSSNIT
jgi:hypothetical protein